MARQNLARLASIHYGNHRGAEITVKVTRGNWWSSLLAHSAGSTRMSSTTAIPPPPAARLVWFGSKPKATYDRNQCKRHEFRLLTCAQSSIAYCFKRTGFPLYHPVETLSRCELPWEHRWTLCYNIGAPSEVRDSAATLYKVKNPLTTLWRPFTGSLRCGAFMYPPAGDKCPPVKAARVRHHLMRCSATIASV